jgi:hypothetical protein
MAKQRRVNLLLRPRDIRRLELISFAHGRATWSAVMRSALLALSVQLGMEKNEMPEDLRE